jgi:hypothetical protein
MYDQPLWLDLSECTKARVMNIRTVEKVRSDLERGLTRPAENRWLPIVVVDGVRQTMGIVRMERIIQTMLRSAQQETFWREDSL